PSEPRLARSVTDWAARFSAFRPAGTSFSPPAFRKTSRRLTEVMKHEDRLRRAKYLGALADRLFRNECARLGLNADKAIKSPLLSIITRQGGRVVAPSKPSPGQSDGTPS